MPEPLRDVVQFRDPSSQGWRRFLSRRPYRYFPDRYLLLTTALAGTLPSPVDASAPGFASVLIDHARGPVVDIGVVTDARVLTQLKQDLAAVISAESVVTLLDLDEVTVEGVVASLVRSATAITAADWTSHLKDYDRVRPTCQPAAA